MTPCICFSLYVSHLPFTKFETFFAPESIQIITLMKHAKQYVAFHVKYPLLLPDIIKIGMYQ